MNTNYIVKGPTMMPIWIRVARDTQDDVTEHFYDVHNMLIDRLMKLAILDHSVTVEEEKELHFMLDAILSAQWFLSEKKKEK